MPKALVLIPARYASTRFPGKPLAEIAGKSMIRRVFENCSTGPATSKNQIEIIPCVVTDNEQIQEHVIAFGGKVVRVDDDVPSGTERIALAYERFFSDDNFDLVINVQGDEPLLKCEQISQLALMHLSSSFDVATLVSKKTDTSEFSDPNKVKVIFSETSKQCFYFSRAQVPYVRTGELDYWFFHIGVYSYRPKALLDFAGHELGRYEDLEKLEQLRGLEAGLTYGAIETDLKLMGIDTPEDLKKVELILGETNE